MTGDSRPFAGDQREHQAERYPAPDPEGSAYRAESRKGDMRDRVQHHAHTLSFRCRALQSGNFGPAPSGNLDCCKYSTD